jgi:hypothetical protein
MAEQFWRLHRRHRRETAARGRKVGVISCDRFQPYFPSIDIPRVTAEDLLTNGCRACREAFVLMPGFDQSWDVPADCSDAGSAAVPIHSLRTDPDKKRDARMSDLPRPRSEATRPSVAF